MNRHLYIQSKIVTLEEAKRKIANWHLNAQKIVFTNGCFDIIHRGHVTYLVKAAEFGNKLIVGLNTDNSVKLQGKGPNRPINDEESRALVIASLGFVDLVVLFDDQTPANVIQELIPDVLIKGADYDPLEKDKTSKKYIVGSDTVLKHGGEVAVVDLEEGFSTTGLIAKIG